MTTPTPDEITAALAVLRRVPGVRDIDSIGVIERKNAPIWRMTRELNELAVATDLTPVVLAEVAARHGLRITTDPGELIQYRLVRQAANGHVLHDASVSYVPDQGGLNAAREDCAKYADPEGCCPRIAAVYLIPEGGQR